MSRPELLYRGTPSKDASLFVPKESMGQDPSERLFVSATTDKTVAVQFIVPTESINHFSGIFAGIYYYVCDDKQKFRELDKGGAVYVLPAKGFEFNPNIGGGVWVNHKSVKPVSKEDMQSGLDAMIEAGVQVYFLDPKTYSKIKESTDQRIEMLRGLISENMRLDRNIKELE